MKKYRNTETGRYVGLEAVEANPATTVTENDRLPEQLRQLENYVDGWRNGETSDEAALAYLKGLEKALSFFPRN